MNIIERFIKKTIERPNGCREWTLCKDRQGYGVCSSIAGQVRAHRAAYVLFKGPIPKGWLVMHSCDNPSCVNPDHLTLGTHAQNQADKAKRHRSIFGDAHHKAKLTNEQALAIYKDPRVQTVIAAEYGVSQATVGKIKVGELWGQVTGAKWNRPGHFSGTRSYQAKFTEDDVRAIRASSDTTANLARRYAVAYPTIERIRTRKTYQSVRD